MADPTLDSNKDLETQPLVSNKEHKGLQQEDEFLTRGPDGKCYAPFLDITRICCVACVAIDHGYRPFGEWNTLLGQDWVLQYLYLVCGACFGISRSSLLSYEARLGKYVLIGIMVNWLAWVVTGKDWRNNMFNVIFHLWFVVGLMIYAAVLAPLRPYLQRARDQVAAQQDHEVSLARTAAESKDGTLRSVALIFGGIAAIALVFRVILDPLFSILAPVTWQMWRQLGEGAKFWGLPSSPAESEEFLEQISTYCMLTSSNLYLILVCPRVFVNISFTAWAVFINTYLHRMLFYRAAHERPFHGLDLMMLALTVYYFGMRHRRTLGIYAARYWFIVIFICGLVWRPGSFGRFDETPPEEIHMRVRVNFVEAVFMLVWLIAGEHIAKPEIFTVDKLEFLNDWALLVFLVHKAVHMILPSPVNWVFLVALAPACWLVRRAL